MKGKTRNSLVFAKEGSPRVWQRGQVTDASGVKTGVIVMPKVKGLGLYLQTYHKRTCVRTTSLFSLGFQLLNRKSKSSGCWVDQGSL